ncbi:hypothetical protein BD289DRAFT_192933 [Coniella lustricola]|uniref:Uncharacterized protein n=1 Tax=Coniella lustricola TaxID=2025994 RepID=A0A2T3ALY3_9PEZI|nr:hypothetical protein BD289DRAFT_192933 [Coniella lustricola]
MSVCGVPFDRTPTLPLQLHQATFPARPPMALNDVLCKLNATLTMSQTRQSYHWKLLACNEVAKCNAVSRYLGSGSGSAPVCWTNKKPPVGGNLYVNPKMQEGSWWSEIVACLGNLAQLSFGILGFVCLSYVCLCIQVASGLFGRHELDSMISKFGGGWFMAKSVFLH